MTNSEVVNDLFVLLHVGDKLTTSTLTKVDGSPDHSDVFSGSGTSCFTLLGG